MKLYLLITVYWAFMIYTALLFIRIVGSWFPSIARHKVMCFVAFYVDPYLNIFRRIIPPIGGVLDLSPILAFFGLQLLEWVLTQIILRI